MRKNFFMIVLLVLAVVGVALVYGSNLTQPRSSERPSPSNTVLFSDPVLVGAGDIASCDNPYDEATAQVLDAISGTVFTLGDNVYPDGTRTQFEECYEPTWGRHKARTRPAPGNHDYNTKGASAYFQYFGKNAGVAGRGYYGYDLGQWHIVVLNTNCGQVEGCGEGSPQLKWLQAELAAHPARCTVAYMHHPRFSSGLRRGTPALQRMWEVLSAGGVDVVLAGHHHGYERFAPMDNRGNPDPDRGVRMFIVGTGGRSLYPFLFTLSASEIRNNTSYGVLKLTLHPSGYDWEFVPASGSAFRDVGTGSCHS